MDPLTAKLAAELLAVFALTAGGGVLALLAYAARWHKAWRQVVTTDRNRRADR